MLDFSKTEMFCEQRKTNLLTWYLSQKYLKPVRVESTDGLSTEILSHIVARL